MAEEELNGLSDPELLSAYYRCYSPENADRPGLHETIRRLVEEIKRRREAPGGEGVGDGA